MKVKRIKKNIVNCLKKIAYDNPDLDNDNKKNSPHCPNFATKCCLTCNKKCWRGKVG